MSDEYPGLERREYIRYRYEKPIKYQILDAGKDGKSGLVNAVSKNLSASGILFSTTAMPGISTLLLLDLDYKTANICQEIEEHALILNNKLFGKVVRIEETTSGSYETGVAFVKKSDDLAERLRKLAPR